jgi:signal transduction histidine kinase
VRLPLAGSLVEEAIRSGSALCIDKALDDPHVRADPRRQRILQEGNVQSLLVVPLVAERGPLGAISLSDKQAPGPKGDPVATGPAREGSFDEADRQLLMLLASSAVVGLENARLYREVQQQAVRAERSRLARDLHDSVTQSLYSLTLFSEAARQLVDEAEDDALAHQLQRIGEIGQQSLKEMRLLIYELRPPVLAEQGLIPALRQRLEAVEGRAGVEARLVVDELRPLPSETEEALYRITQEALNNILKHAQAATVTVRLHLEENHFLLDIEDDGIGFEPAQTTTEAGQGLRNIRERAAALGAAVTISSQPGTGTRLVIRGPLPSEGETE